jgi:hypothetical protein
MKFDHLRFNGTGGKLLCWILTHDKNHELRVKAVAHTWGLS